MQNSTASSCLFIYGWTSMQNVPLTYSWICCICSFGWNFNYFISWGRSDHIDLSYNIKSYKWNQMKFLSPHDCMTVSPQDLVCIILKTYLHQRTLFDKFCGLSRYNSANLGWADWSLFKIYFIFLFNFFTKWCVT